MTYFADSFDRANGALGSNWQGYGNIPTITGGTVSNPNGYWIAQCLAVASAGRLECHTHLLVGAYNAQRTGVVVKQLDDGSGGFWFGVTGWDAPQALSLRSPGNYNGASLGSTSLPSGMGPYIDLGLVWNNGHLTCTVNGTVVLEVDSGDNASGTRCALRGEGSSLPALDFTALGGSEPSLSVSPAIVGNYGGICSSLTLTGGNTAWTAGTPGEPSFTVNHGSITAQTITDLSTATVTYCPGDWLGAAVFTDASTGATAAVVVTSDPGVVPVGGAGLSADAIAYLDRSARAEDESIILNRNESWTGYGVTKTMSETIETVHNTLSQSTYAVDGQAGILALIIQVYDLLNGGSDWGGTATVFGNTSLIKADVDTLASTLADVQGPGGVSLAVLAAALSDLRGVGSPSLADILAASGGGDPTAILNAIAAVRGSGSPDLHDLVGMVDGLRTTHGYDLASVKGWLDALPQAQSGPSAALIVATVAALALAIPTGGASVAAEAVAIGAGPLLDLTTLVEVASVLGELAGIASSIASLRESLTTPTILGAPVWPGADLVTLGPSHDLADGLIVDGPMHGLIVTIGGHPSGAGKYSFGSVDSWQHCGAVVFQNDSGHYERAESFGLPSQILTPHTMASAASATVRLNGGWTGTIRGWTITA